MTVLSGETAVQAQTMSDKEVVESCMNTLRKLFPYKVMHTVQYLLIYLFCDGFGKNQCNACAVSEG